MSQINKKSSKSTLEHYPYNAKVNNQENKKYFSDIIWESRIKIRKTLNKKISYIKYAIFLWPFGSDLGLWEPMTPFHPVEGWSPQQIVRNGRENPDTAAHLDKCEKLLEKDQMKDGGLGGKKLEGTKGVFYVRVGDSRVFYEYDSHEQGKINIIGETNKKCENKVIKNIRQHHD